VFVAGRESVDLSDALGQLADRGAAVVVCDGGPRLLGELVAGALLDELCLSVVPLMGGDPLPVAVMPPGSGLRHFGLADIAEDNGTLFLRYERDGARGS
jgi:riboflavin biosynthesis pyrimidine reductase